MTISPEMGAIIDMVREFGLATADLGLAEQRAALDLDTPAPEGTSVEKVDAGGVPAEWIVAAGAVTDHAVLHLHGGAYTAGGLGSHRGFACLLSAAVGCAVLLIDYRLAPEHPFPAAVDDAIAAYEWLTAERGIDPASLAISGDSAGGGLALALLTRLRDENQPLPTGAALLSPWTDLSLSGDSHATEDGIDPMCSTAGLAVSAAAYAGDLPLDHPGVSPLFADLAGLPPLLVHAGEVEVLRDDSVVLIERATAAGVEVESLIAPGMIHVWHLFAGTNPESTQALATAAAWIAARLSLPTASPSTSPSGGTTS